MAIILLGIVFSVVAACTALLSSGGVKIQSPSAPPTSAAPATTAVPAPTTEPNPSPFTEAPLSIPVAPGFTLTFQIPMPSGVTIPPLQGTNGDQ